MKTGLVLEGGAMRGIYTAGVLDVLMENQIETDGVIGVSAGAIHGSSYIANQMGRSIRYYTKYSKDRHFMSWYSLLTTGDIVGEQFCYHDLPDRLDPFDYQQFKDSAIDFYVVCSNLHTGRAEYIKCTDLKKQMEYLRASASMPFVSKILRIEGKKLLDGGVCDAIPIHAFRKMGYKKNIVVLTRPRGYQKQPENLRLAKIKYHKYPEFIKAIERRPIRYNHALEEVKYLEKKGHIIVIAPSKDLHIGRMEKDPGKIREQYDLGRRDAYMQLTNIKKFI